MKHLLILIALILLYYFQAFPQNTQITSFSKSKKLLLRLYKVNPVTLYCGCSYKGKKPKRSSCGYIPKKNKKRANRIEWEHVVPAHAFGQSFSEWRDGHHKCVKKNGKNFKGRKCAEKVNKEYRIMQADMFNLDENFRSELISKCKEELGDSYKLEVSFLNFTSEMYNIEFQIFKTN